MLDVSTDYLLGLNSTRVINVSGLSEEVVAHLSQLVEDFRKRLIVEPGETGAP